MSLSEYQAGDPMFRTHGWRKQSRKTDICQTGTFQPFQDAKLNDVNRDGDGVVESNTSEYLIPSSSMSAMRITSASTVH
jgi:hypothetical protein